MFLIPLLFILLLCPALRADLRPSLLFDRPPTSPAGAENLLTAHRLLFSLKDRILPRAWTKEDTALKKGLGVAYRAAKLLLVENPVTFAAFLTQHEIFGHGARYWEIGYTDMRFEVHLPFPYGTGKGWAFAGGPPQDRAVTTHERLMTTSGGVEANAVLARRVRADWMMEERIPAGEELLFLFTANDLAAYIWRTRWGMRGPAGNDILHWLSRLNTFEGYPLKENYRLTLEDLSRHSLVGLLSPFTLYALYTLFVRNLWQGREGMKMPMVRLGRWRWLPSMRLGLTPFGGEFILENYLKADSRLHVLRFRIGQPAFHRFWGLGWEGYSLYRRGRLGLDGRLSLWRQPELVLGTTGGTREQSGWGAAAFLAVRLNDLIKAWGIGLRFDLGYKTDGFLEGERLSRGPVIRVGLTLGDPLFGRN